MLMKPDPIEAVQRELEKLRKGLPNSAAALTDARSTLVELREPVVQQIDDMDDHIAESVLSANQQERDNLDQKRTALAKVLRDLNAAIDVLAEKIEAARAAEQRSEMEKLAKTLLPAQTEYAALCGEVAQLVRDIGAKASRLDEINRRHSEISGKLNDGGASDLRRKTVFAHPDIVALVVKRGPLHSNPVNVVRAAMGSIGEWDLKLLEAIGQLRLKEDDLR